MEYHWSIDNLINYYSIQVQSVNTIWNFYGVVILGIFAFIGASPQLFSKPYVRLLFLIGFALFAISNFLILQDVQNHLYLASRELAEVSKELPFKTQEFKKVIQEVPRIEPRILGYIHIVTDSITALFILFIPLKNISNKK